jgi:predicted lipoprotein with Yx(FWY)xxD motif
MRARLYVPFSLGLLTLVALAGCGGSSGSGSATAATGGAHSGASAGSSGMATVDVANNQQLGKILVDAQGRTLYLFQKDSSNRSNCTSGCAKIWPPDVAMGKVSAGNGVTASMLGTAKRSDGSMQVTYGGHPLYTYTADTAPGQTSGNGINSFGAVWNAVQPSGSQAPAGASSGSGGSGNASSGAGGTGGASSGGSYGY